MPPPPRPCGSPSPRATASASRRWSPGSSCGRCRPCATRAASSPPTPRRQLRTKTWPELAKWHGARASTATGSPTPRPRCIPSLPGHERTWRVDCHHLVGEQHRGLRRPAQQGQPRLRPVRRGLGHPRRRVGDHRGRADRRRHRAVLGGLRQPDAQHRPLPRMLRRRPLRPSLDPPADRFALGRRMTNKAQIAHWVGRLRRGFRLRPRAREGRVPARRHPAVHRQRARRRTRWRASSTRIRTAPLVMGVDIARQGDDQSVIRFRRGLDARSIPAGEVPHPRPHADGQPRHGAGQCAQPRRGVRRRHRHRLGRRRSPQPARLPAT